MPDAALAAMPAFPVSVFAAALLLYLLLRLVLRGEGNGWQRALVGLAAMQSLIVAGTQHYGIEALRPVQPVTATLVPAAAYLAFLASAVRPIDPARDWVHLGGPVFTAFCLAFAPATLDAVIVLVFLAYGGVMLLALRGGEDALPRIRLESGGPSLTAWRLLALLLIGSALSDLAITLADLAGAMAWRGAIVSLTSSLLMLALGLAGLERAGDEPQGEAAEDDARPETPAADAATLEADRALVARARAVLTAQKLAADPDLTLARLARRLGVPAKALSAAVNRAEGHNVSQFVNAVRVEAACADLATGAPVTQAMLDAGFRTKSNFNREFRRLTGLSPTEWRAKGAPPATGETPPRP
ncbi:helix-turn-helix domain-containing protein [Ancylobacter sp. WKF20]|uniref:helix-turn-helix domain-containing protein n=1 Tax=Ancylobacter sp. WKF20 TaxID=3039801 RepID=UPI002434513A|nr:helix-turn-helix domain-containing protein [Ancylobacter sp. WKF20]WGD28789.1 helix-turn-helix domain-containing protein [Ancylobacter sp. WKF20]